MALVARRTSAPRTCAFAFILGDLPELGDPDFAGYEYARRVSRLRRILVWGDSAMAIFADVKKATSQLAQMRRYEIR